MMRIYSLIIALSLAPFALGAENLVHNGGFDEVKGDGPVGWERVGGSAAELAIGGDKPHSGTHFLRFISRGSSHGWRTNWHLIEPIPVEPGVGYRVEYYFKLWTRSTSEPSPPRS